jgi:hypothetical protein
MQRWRDDGCSISETSASFYQTARHIIPEDSRLHTRRRENLKSQHMLVTAVNYHLQLVSINCRHPSTGEFSRRRTRALPRTSGDPTRNSAYPAPGCHAKRNACLLIRVLRHKKVVCTETAVARGVRLFHHRLGFTFWRRRVLWGVAPRSLVL